MRKSSLPFSHWMFKILNYISETAETVRHTDPKFGVSFVPNTQWFGTALGGLLCKNTDKEGTKSHQRSGIFIHKGTDRPTFPSLHTCTAV